MNTMPALSPMPVAVMYHGKRLEVLGQWPVQDGILYECREEGTDVQHRLFHFECDCFIYAEGTFR
jgi:hypothetical protein